MKIALVQMEIKEKHHPENTAHGLEMLEEAAAHSDLAASYVMVAWNNNFWLAYRQAKRLLGNRVELVLLESKAQQAEALKAFNPKHSAAENAKAMLAAAKEV